MIILQIIHILVLAQLILAFITSLCMIVGLICGLMGHKHFDKIEHVAETLCLWPFYIARRFYDKY